MERLNYTVVIVSTRDAKVVASDLYFDSHKEAERYAEGLTVGASIAGKRYGVMMLLNREYDAHTTISKQMDYRKMQVYFRNYEWRKKLFNALTI